MQWNDRWTRMGLGIGLATFLLAAPGCGGNKGGSEDTAVVVPAPGEVADAKASGKGGGSSESSNAATPAPEARDVPARAEAPPVKAEGWGTLKGQITFDGDPPAPTLLVKKGDTSAKDPQVCAAQDIPSQRLVVDPKTKGVKWAIVYIPKPTVTNPEAVSERKNPKNATVEFDQKNCTFEPHVLAAMTGTDIRVISHDPVQHNVHTKLQNNPYNNALSNGQSADLKAVSERDPGKVVCDIHNWMSAWWLITDSPYFAVTDEQGNFEIKNVPAGTQKVVVWTEAASYLTPKSGDKVNIKADGTTDFNKKLEPAKVRPE